MLINNYGEAAYIYDTEMRRKTGTGGEQVA
jgi:hypothetical protein